MHFKFNKGSLCMNPRIRMLPTVGYLPTFSEIILYPVTLETPESQAEKITNSYVGHSFHL